MAKLAAREAMAASEKRCGPKATAPNSSFANAGASRRAIMGKSQGSIGERVIFEFEIVILFEY